MRKLQKFDANYMKVKTALTKAKFNALKPNTKARKLEGNSLSQPTCLFVQPKFCSIIKALIWWSS